MTNKDKDRVNAQKSIDERNEAMGLNIKTPKRFGYTLLFIVFGVFGLWSAIAPLDGAARAPGQVTVKSYKKIVQHLEGGIVGKIYVENGDIVKTGEPLLELNNTQSLAQLERAKTKFIAFRAKEARLIAERDEASFIVFPSQWSKLDMAYSDEMAAQKMIFESRQATLNGETEVLQRRIEQLESRITGLHALKKSKETLAESYAEEVKDIKLLLSQGFSDKGKLRPIERSLASFEGEAAELLASIASTEVQIGETNLQIIQLEREVKNEIAIELADAQTNLKDIVDTIKALKDIVSRTKIISPSAGVINGLQVHTVGGIIAPGAAIAEVVPLAEELILEARVSALDIDRVFPGQQARIRFSSFGNKTPEIFGQLLSLSADVYSDSPTQQPYYLARVEVNPESIEELDGLELVPGMPAEVFIATGSRTLLQYMLKPFSNTIARSFIED
ncbi:HlyD family type I secretion periplasmic adaptor subunit [Gammaproteobacteria bacterium]|nr:HlyD family type I secretion periplasmic adaptor subunit [Gammaproteobacteria bacterium]